MNREPLVLHSDLRERVKELELLGLRAAQQDVALREKLAACEKDAERFKWLCDDLDALQRARRSHLLNRISTMSYSAICTFIDAAIAERGSKP